MYLIAFFHTEVQVHLLYFQSIFLLCDFSTKWKMHEPKHPRVRSRCLCLRASDDHPIDGSERRDVSQLQVWHLLLDTKNSDRMYNSQEIDAYWLIYLSLWSVLTACYPILKKKLAEASDANIIWNFSSQVLVRINSSLCTANIPRVSKLSD
jgi:hypothetical protein